MTGDLRQEPRCAGRIAFLKLAVVAVLAGAALMSACSQPSDSQQTAAQQQQQAADEQTRKEADEKAWADAEKTGTVAAYTAYLQNFGAGAHVSEASQRIVALNEQARKAADEKAWADAEKAGTAAAYTAYIQNFGARSSILCAYYPQESRKNDHRRLSMSTRWYTSAIIGLPIATTAPGPPAVVPRGRGGRCVGPVGHRSMPKSRGRKPKKPRAPTKGAPKQSIAHNTPPREPPISAQTVQQEPSIAPQTVQQESSIPRQTPLQSILKWTMKSVKRAWVLLVTQRGSFT